MKRIKTDRQRQAEDAAKAKANGHESMPAAMPDALAIVCSCMAREAKLTARIAGPEEQALLLAVAEAFRDPAKVQAFIGRVA